MSASIAPPPPATLPPLPAPEPGHYFADQHEARDRAYRLDPTVLRLARAALAECYGVIHDLHDRCLRPLDGHPPRRDTAAVLAELLSDLIDADGNSVGYALGQIDEAEAWAEAPPEQLPLYAWAHSCAPHTTMRAGGV